MPLPPFDTPARVMDYAAEQLRAAVRDPKHDWHWPQLATVGADGPGVRVVVLRDYDRAGPWFTFYTDARAGKVRDLTGAPGAQVPPTCEASFYHGADRTQLRLRGPAKLLPEATRRRLWGEMNSKGKLSYATATAPGSTLTAAGDGLSATWRAGEPSEEEQLRAFANFHAYEVDVARAQFLQLSANGQRRCAWGGWSASGFEWLVP